MPLSQGLLVLVQQVARLSEKAVFDGVHGLLALVPRYVFAVDHFLLLLGRS